MDVTDWSDSRPLGENGAIMLVILPGSVFPVSGLTASTHSYNKPRHFCEEKLGKAETRQRSASKYCQDGLSLASYCHSLTYRTNLEIAGSQGLACTLVLCRWAEDTDSLCLHNGGRPVSLISGFLPPPLLRLGLFFAL